VDQIHLEWELVSNFVGDNDEFLAQFILDNQSNQVLADEGWALFFNMAPRRILETEHADITHLNGDWYKLSPKAGFNLAPGEAVTISYKGIEGVIKETDAPMGLYFVFYGDNDEETIVPVTNWKVSPFVREEQLLRGQEDHEKPYSPAKRFEENAAMERVDEKSLLPIIPTPYYMDKKTGSFELAAPLEIHHGQGLENEAEYLSEKLAEISGESIVIKEGAGTEAKIRLGLADIELNGKRDEVYTLEINDSGINITGSDAAGVFYGVQSLLALLGPDAYMGKGMPFHLPHLEIKDGPRFAFRSLHMDVSRNFQDKETIKRTLDLMSHYKLNHFLFYTTEDEGWRLEIDGLPELTSVGGQRQHVSDVSEAALHPAYGSGPEAYMEGRHGSGFYTKEDFVEILKYAKARHITVIPELNFPGHARAAIKSMEARYQRLMEEGDEEGAEEYRLIDPEDRSEYLSAQAFKDNVVSVARESTYRFYEKVVDELAKMYEAAGLVMDVMHAGGDELDGGDDEGGAPYHVGEPEELVEDLTLVDDLLDPWERLELVLDDVEQCGVLQTHAERGRERVRVDGLDERRLVLEQLREAVVGLALGLVEHLRDDGLRLELFLQVLLLLRGDRGAGPAVAQEDRDLDPPGPVVGRQVDLGRQQQAGAEQRQRHGHRQDHGDRHHEVAPQADDGLTQDVAPARGHAGLLVLVGRQGRVGQPP
jgi:hexosaminidase